MQNQLKGLIRTKLINKDRPKVFPASISACYRYLIRSNDLRNYGFKVLNMKGLTVVQGNKRSIAITNYSKKNQYRYEVDLTEREADIFQAILMC